MPQEGIPGYLKYRVLDNNSGAVIIADLPHPHRSKWTVRALQQGMPGTTSLGDFTIPLYASGSDQFKRSQYLFNLLAVGQRIEGFLGDVIDGSPRFSGVITKIRRPLKDDWEISGADSVWLLQQSQLFQGEQILAPFPPKFAYDVFKATREIVWDDDFTNWNSGGSANYHQNNFNFTSSDPYFSMPAIWASITGAGHNSYVVTNSTWGVNAQYAPSEITIQGTLISSTASGASAGGIVGILLLTDNPNTGSGELVRAVIQQTGASTGVYTVAVEIWSFSSGAYTLQASNTGVYPSVNNVFTFELKAVIYQWGASRVITAILNGKEATNHWTTTSLVASGGIGVYWEAASGFGGSPGVYINRLRFVSRTGNWGTNRFGVGATTTSAVQVQNNVQANGQSHLDMLMLASSTDGYWLRKNPGFGYKSDTLDYQANPGVDRSNQIAFEEGRNVLDAQVAPVAELYSTDARVNGIPNSAVGDSGGSFTWSKVGNVGDMALIDTVVDVGIPGYGFLRGQAFKAGNRKSNPMQGQEALIARTPDVLDNWRELDFVMVDIPTLGIYRQKSLVVGYEFTEGDTTQKIWLGQFPDRALVTSQIQHLMRPIEGLFNTYQPR